MKVAIKNTTQNKIAETTAKTPPAKTPDFGIVLAIVTVSAALLIHRRTN